LCFVSLLLSLALASVGLGEPFRYVMVEHLADYRVGDRKRMKTSHNPIPAQHNLASLRSPWSQIPTHMLSMPPSGSLGQVRAYSSDSKDGTGLEFGFQSLGSLFPAPPAPGRYSRPKERRAEAAVSREPEERAPAVEVLKDGAQEKPYLRTFSLPEMAEESAARTKAGSKAANVPTEDNLVRRVEGEASAEGELIRRMEGETSSAGGLKRRMGRETSAPTGRRREKLPAKIPQVSGKPRTVKPEQEEGKRPYHFAKKVKKASAGPMTETRPNAKAWGLSQEDQNTVDSITDPSAPMVTGVSSDKHNVVESAKIVPTAPEGRHLTHVKSSGEAHMVDVGDKASTKRVAIAVAHIGLSKEVYDVLGIARIAGIMAAKRTSDIIPLCHPLAISRAEVDVYLVPFVRKASDLPNKGWQLTCPNGRLVAIQARVECVGPTGVEMEAFMAVQGAALTIIDMCKAVDKTLAINGAKLVYKSGGRSGTSRDFKWAAAVGLDKFTDDGEMRDGVDAVPGRRVG
jgi:molybdenum cofactor biosynthesis protein MoaC